ncbi:MAG: sensor histidine kinase [Myxococcales bacterium]|nr:sensor histidine kinase [Myxococcales bacterium]
MRLRLPEPVPDQGPALEAAFRAYAVELSAEFAVSAVLLITFFTVAWWPLDAWVMQPGAEREAFGVLRSRALVVEAVALAALLGSGWIRERILWLGPLAYAALMAAFGSSLGLLGADGLIWLADAFVGVVPAAFIPLSLKPRIAATALIGGGLVGGFFVVAPETLTQRAGLGQVSFALFAVVFTILIGEILLRVFRRSFMQARQLDAANAELADLSDSLAARVAAQTQDLRSLAAHLDEALESQRRRIARDLHDDLGQALTAIRYALARLDGKISHRTDDIEDMLEDLSTLLDGASGSVRGFLTELRPRVLDDYGLATAAEWLGERVRAAGLACAVSVDPAFPGAADADGLPTTARLDGDLELALFRVLQEATTNALKHARATTVTLALKVDGGLYAAAVTDDGVGFDPSEGTPGFGLLGLDERVRARGGRLDIRSAPGAGTTIRAALPGAGGETGGE